MAKKGEVKLIGAWTSPYVMRARIALNIKSVDYEFLEEKVGAKSELLLKSNPVHKKIPVLIHHDKPIAESLIIVQYIDEVTWTTTDDAPSILPSHPYPRAIHRFWAAYIDDKWFPAWKGIGLAKGEVAEQKINGAKEGLALLEEEFPKISNGKPFFGGDQIGLLDIALGCFLGWVRVGELTHNVPLIDHSTTPHLAGWAARFVAHPAVKDVMPDPKDLLEFLRVNFMKPAPPSSK
ncbi:hypothetical protein Dimus_031375 [Dionaea muscipula]